VDLNPKKHMGFENKVLDLEAVIFGGHVGFQVGVECRGSQHYRKANRHQ